MPSGEKVIPEAPLSPLIVLITPGVAIAREMSAPEDPNTASGAARIPTSAAASPRRLAPAFRTRETALLRSEGKVKAFALPPVGMIGTPVTYVGCAAIADNQMVEAAR